MNSTDSFLALVLVGLLVLVITRYDSRRADISSLEYKIFSFVNLERVKIGLSALQLNDSVSDVARLHSLDMARRSYLDHRDPAGNSHMERLMSEGFQVRGASAENIAKASIVSTIKQPGNVKEYKSLEELAKGVTEGWMGSPGHRRNISNKDFIETGVGVALGLDGETYYFTQVFIGG